MLPNKSSSQQQQQQLPSSSSSSSSSTSSANAKVMFPDKRSTTKQMKSSTLTNAAGLSSLITFTVLLLAWISGFASRLFAVIRFESIIHEFDPWYVTWCGIIQHVIYTIIFLINYRSIIFPLHNGSVS